MRYGTVPSSAFVPGHITWVTPLSAWCAAFYNRTAGWFTIPSNTRKPYPCTYWFQVDENRVNVAAAPVEGVDYGEQMEIPDWVFSYLRTNKRLDGADDKRRKDATEALAKKVKGEVIKLGSVRAVLAGETVVLTMNPQG